jgi:hypothetical protein
MRQMLLRASRGEEPAPPSKPGLVAAKNSLTELSDPGLEFVLPSQSQSVGVSQSMGASQRTEDSVAARWLDADLAQESTPKSRPEAAAIAPKSRPEIALPRLDTPPRQDMPPRRSSPIDPLPDPSGAGLEIDDRALARKPAAPPQRPSAPRLPTASPTRSSSGNISAVAAPIEPPRPTPTPAQPPPTVSAPRVAVSSAVPVEEASSPLVRWTLIVLAAACVVGLVALGLRSWVTRPPSTPPPSSALPPSTDPRTPPTKRVTAPQFVQFTIEVQPADVAARMRLDGIPGATSPIRVRRGTRHVLEVSASGFVDARLELRSDRDQTISVTLVPAP